MDLGADLNERQKEAVAHTDGPLLVVAGAGAGKTRVITARIARLIVDGVKPEQILAVTFTNKAAGEMRERVSRITGRLASGNSASTPFVSTFHALGVHILKASGQSVGVSRWFNILDRTDQRAIIKRAMKKHDIDPKQFEPRGIISTISKSKGNKVSISVFEEDAGADYYQDIVLKVWKEYEKELRASDSLDFDDLLLKTVQLLEKEEKVRKLYQDKWRYIHIDEYQDTNKVQYELIKLLAGDRKNVFVVGDEDQMIYGWRGADYENIKRFEREFAIDGASVPVVMLEENYRSTPEILTAANAVIKKNGTRKDKNLFTSLPTGDMIEIYEAIDGADEANYAVDSASKLIKGSTRAEDIAVLYRANFQSRAIEEAFLSAGVDYTLLGTRFFERMEVKDVLSYAKAALNPSDKMSVARVINTPRRGIGDKTVEKLFAGKMDELTPATREKVKNFYLKLDYIKSKILGSKPSEAIKFIAKESGYEEMLMANKEEGRERLENVHELVTLATKYDGLAAPEGIERLIEDASLASDQDTLAQEDKKKSGVRLMTVHAAKGLEFEHVFIVGLEQDLFPHTHSDEIMSDKKLEEERRLFYVALTRAKKQLHLSHASVRNVYGQQLANIPSEFLDDIPNNLIAESAIETERKKKGRLTNYLDFDGGEDVIY